MRGSPIISLGHKHGDDTATLLLVSLALGTTRNFMAKAEIKRFIKDIQSRFPDTVPLMEKHESWALTFRMEEFANSTTFAFNENRLAEAERHLSYISQKLDSATSIEFEYIDKYYVEHLFWNATPAGIKAGWPLVPNNLKKLYIDFHGKEPKSRS